MAIRLRAYIMIAGAVFAASILGLLTRSEGTFAAFWPANPIVLGVLIRHPNLNRPAFWMAAFFGYFTANIATENGIVVSLWLSCANLAGVIGGYLLYRQVLHEDKSINRPISLVWLFVVCVVSAVVSALIGAGVANVMFGRDFLAGFAFWFTTELVNSIIFLPAILSAPTRKQAARFLLRISIRNWTLDGLLPAICLVILLIASILVNRPGSFVYPIPALLWCALSFSLFTTAVLTLLYSVWAMASMSMGLLPFLLGDDPLVSMLSQRLAVALIALGPLVVASISSTKNDLLKRLEYAANHDFLTGTLARRALLESAENLLKGRTSRFFCVLMLDIDNFKSINDVHGHAVGDLVLVAFVQHVQQQLSDKHLFGRMGGEEFAIIFETADISQAQDLAERVRGKMEEVSVCGTGLKTTVSGGLVAWPLMRESTLDELLAMADKRLYRAKNAGKNRVVFDASDKIAVVAAAKRPEIR